MNGPEGKAIRLRSITTRVTNDQKVQWFKVQSLNAACLCLCCGGAESNLVTTAFSSEFLAGFLAEVKMPV